MNEDKILEYLASIQQSIAGIQEDVAELKEDVAELKEDVAELKEDVAELKEDVAVLKEGVADLNERVVRLEDDSQFIKGVVAKIEVEHGRKLGAFYDGLLMNREIVNTYDDRLRKVEKDVETHSIELRYLKAGIG
ncbi:MAG: hypothetical protein HFE44_14060 [Oscillospiraceae bacterium]|nr:hypothetical protein [Oscillospiraceae bacterium]